MKLRFDTILIIIALVCTVLICGCEKADSHSTFRVTGKFVMLPKSEQFRNYRQTLKAVLYEKEPNGTYWIPRYITGHIPSDFRSYDTIYMNADIAFLAPEFDDDVASYSKTGVYSIVEIENVPEL
jgi:hypothetical protein